MYLGKVRENGQCQYCGRETEVVAVKFDDGKTAVLCWNDIKKRQRLDSQTMPETASMFDK